MLHDSIVLGSGPILMVDDSANDTFLARKCFERSRLGNEFITLDSGAALFAHLDGVIAGRHPMPALILLDINMPGMSGYDVLVAIRKMPAFLHIPIITMLTNSDDPRDAEKSSALGADGFFTKPSTIPDYVGFFDAMAG